jgi:geranylgeranyl diphosphate synthase type II
VTGDSKELGKNTGSDENNNKQTYVTINGLDKSAEDVAKMSNEAVHILESLGRESGFLSELITMLIDRRK